MHNGVGRHIMWLYGEQSTKCSCNIPPERGPIMDHKNWQYVGFFIQSYSRVDVKFFCLSSLVS